MMRKIKRQPGVLLLVVAALAVVWWIRSPATPATSAFSGGVSEGIRSAAEPLPDQGGAGIGEGDASAEGTVGAEAKFWEYGAKGISAGYIRSPAERAQAKERRAKVTYKLPVTLNLDLPDKYTHDPIFDNEQKMFRQYGFNLKLR